MAAVVVEDLVKRYGKAPRVIEALAGVSFHVEEGEVFGLLGPNGAGKTTLIKVLATLAKADEGRAVVAGVDVAEDPHGVRERIGLVFQEPSLDNQLSGRENLALSASLYDLPRSTADERMRSLLGLMDLSKRGDDRVKTYSGGMKRRLEIARGLLHEPEVLFLDEPTLGLDPQTRERLWAYIRGLKEKGTTVVITTHYMDEADALCDRVAIINQGVIQALDAPDALKAGMGETVVRLRARGLSLEDVLDAPGVSSAKPVEREEGGFLVSLEAGVEGLPGFLRAIDGIEHLEVRTPTLQDVFLRLTGRSLREGAGSGEDWTDEVSRYQRAGGDL